MFTYPFTRDLIVNLTTQMHATKTLCQLWFKMCIFARKHISNCSFKTVQCIYRNFLILTPCVLPLISRNEEVFTKTKTYLMGTVPLHGFLTHFWQVMALKRAPRPMSFYRTFWITAYYVNHKRIKKNLHVTSTWYRPCTYLDKPSSTSCLWAAYFSLTAWYSLLDCLKACNQIHTTD